MQRQHTSRVLCATMFAALVGASVATADGIPPRYQVTVLDSLPGHGTSAYAINDLGESTGESGSNLVAIGTHAFIGQPDGEIESIETVAGYDLSAGQVITNGGYIAGELTKFVNNTGQTSIFRYTPSGGMVDIGKPSSGTVNWVVDMNESGMILVNNIDVSTQAYVYSDQNGWQGLGTLGGFSTTPNDINDLGQVVGSSLDSDIHRRAFLWENGVMTDLGTLGGTSSVAYYTSNTGVIVGSSTMPDGSTCAFRYSSASGMEPLPTLPNTTEWTATWASGSGMIAGWYMDGQEHHSFCYSDAEGLVDLGTNSGVTGWTEPVAMNDAGEILLLRLDMDTYQTSAMLYSPGRGAYDLNDVLATDLGWRIDSAAGLNASGQIVVSGYIAGASALLTPITPGDLNADGNVNITDLAMLLSNFGVTSDAAYAQGDISGDGAVSLSDLGVLLAAFGQ